MPDADTAGMSIAVTHFAVGQACTTALLAALGAGDRRRFALTVAGGAWALVPDALAPYAPLWVATGLRETVLANLFWFHGVLDAVDGGRSPGVAVAAVALLLVTTFADDARRAAR